jgi:hypothetical protein
MWRHGANEMPLMTHLETNNMETNTAHLEPAKEKADEPLPRTTCCGLEAWDGYLTGEKAADVWLKLHETSRSTISRKDALTESERDLYEALTVKFTFDAKMLATVVSDSCHNAKHTHR